MASQQVEQTPQWALVRINEAREKQLTELDLNGRFREERLTSLPKAITQLTNLQTLYLRHNRLTVVPDAIAQLTSLQTLDLSSNELKIVPQAITQLANLQGLNLAGNQLTAVPKAIAQLTNLQELILDSNRLKAVPEAIAQLTNLQGLNLGGNQLTVVPEAIAQLANLHTLELGYNQLTVVPDFIFDMKQLTYLGISGFGLTVVPETITQLINLRRLNLAGNQLTAVPEAITQLTNLRALYLSRNRLTVVPRWLVELPKLRDLDLWDNPIETPPPEVLKLEMGKGIDLKALRAYFRQQEEEGESSIYEAKLLIVGEPGAGKTSLTRKLIDPAAPLPAKDESTEGIDVHTWSFPLPEKIVTHQSSIENPEFRVNIWDFGGQEIYHATHQFFLTRRSLYVVVADARKQKTDFFHWLDLIEHLSDRSPVLIFNNAFQNRHWAINEQQLQAHFPDTFQKPFAFNLADDAAGLAYLRQKIQEQITSLPHVGDVLPRTWAQVRGALESNPRATVTRREFLQLCRDNGFTRTDDALQLSGYLHDLGVILHFQDDPLLKRTVILQPEWGTDAVYRVLDNDEVKENRGHFNRDDLRRIWHEEEYALLHDELLALMMKFQLCYAIPNRKDQYIAPQLLGEQPPDYDLGAADAAKRSLHLRYKYEAFMPKGLLTRFIAKMHNHIAVSDASGEQLVWRTGVVLAKDGTRAEVVEFYHRHEIRIRVTGKNMRELLTIISYELDELHRRFHRLQFDKLIPCNCATCRQADDPYFYRLNILKTRLEHGKDVIECDRPPFETVTIRPLLDDVGFAAQEYDLPTLLRLLNNAFNEEETRTLCLEFGVKYDNLSDGGLKGRQRELLLWAKRNGRLQDLVELVREKRPYLK